MECGAATRVGMVVLRQAPTGLLQELSDEAKDNILGNNIARFLRLG